MGGWKSASKTTQNMWAQGENIAETTVSKRGHISLEANTSSDSHLWMFQSTVTSGIIFISIMHCKKERKFFYDFDWHDLTLLLQQENNTSFTKNSPSTSNIQILILKVQIL